ncbi:MAG: hypothetical protein ACLUHE_06835 [Christensenellales bacterium]
MTGDDPARSRGYEHADAAALRGREQRRSGQHARGWAPKLLGAMDTNLNAMTAVTLASAVKGGDDRSEMALPTQAQVTSEEPAARRRDGHAEHGERGAL